MSPSNEILSVFTCYFQPLKLSATFPKKLSQLLPLWRASPCPVIFLPYPVVRMSYGVLPPRILAPVPSQLRCQLPLLLCLLAPLLSLLKIISVFLAQSQSPPVARELAMTAFLLCPLLCLNTAYLAIAHPPHHTGIYFF